MNTKPIYDTKELIPFLKRTEFLAKEIQHLIHTQKTIGEDSERYRNWAQGKIDNLLVELINLSDNFSLDVAKMDTITPSNPT